MRAVKVFVNRHKSGKLLGFADVIFALSDGGNGCITIKGFKIFKGQDDIGLQVGLPSRKDDKGEYHPLVWMDFDNEDAKVFMNHITDVITREYHNPTNTRKPQVQAQPTQSQPQNQPVNSINDEDIPF